MRRVRSVRADSIEQDAVAAPVQRGFADLPQKQRREAGMVEPVAADEEAADVFVAGFVEAVAEQPARRGRSFSVGDEVDFAHQPAVAFDRFQLDRDVRGCGVRSRRRIKKRL